MRLRLNSNKTKTAIEIDPRNLGNEKHFYPMVSVTVFNPGTAHEMPPVVVATFSGKLKANEALIYSAGLRIAGHINDLVNTSGIRPVYELLQNNPQTINGFRIQALSA